MKKSLIAILLSCFLFAGGCRSPDLTLGEQAAKEINTAFVEALNAKDKDGIKALLCEYTLEENDIDEQIEDMFEFFDKSIFPINEYNVHDLGTPEQQSIGGGEHTLSISARILIESDSKKEYRVICYAYVLSPDSKKVGISQIQIIDESNLPEDLDEKINARKDDSRCCYVGEYIE